MNEKIWNQLKDTGQIPAYLNDITLEFQEDRQLRGYIPNDTRLLEKFHAEGDVREYLAVPDAHPIPLLNEVEDETVLEALKDKFMDTLRNNRTSPNPCHVRSGSAKYLAGGYPPESLF